MYVLMYYNVNPIRSNAYRALVPKDARVVSRDRSWRKCTVHCTVQMHMATQCARPARQKTKGASERGKPRWLLRSRQRERAMRLGPRLPLLDDAVVAPPQEVGGPCPGI